MTKQFFDPGGCVGCPPEMGCVGKRSCPQCRRMVTVCDVCGRETDGEDICGKCKEEEYDDE